MAKFDRPQNAIESFKDLKDGDVVYRVYGIWPPATGGACTVVGAPKKFSEHREYSDIHASSKDAIVFDLKHEKYDYTDMNFASDSNLIPGYSHNDNYCFRTEADAAAAVEWLHDQWTSSDGAIARFEAERAMWRAIDDEFSAYDYQDEAA